MSGSETISMRGTGKNYLLRSKEDAQDYRYFPEPDLGAIVVPEEQKFSEWMSLPASSSMWMRVMPTRLVFPSSSTTAST